MANGKNRFLDIAVKRDAEPKNRFLDIAVKSDNSRRDTMPVEDYAEAIDNKSDTLGSFFKGFTHNFDDYAASVNKLLGQEEGAKYWERQRKMNEVETSDHPISKFAGSVLLDPLNLVGGEAIKAGKIGKAIAQEAMTGAGNTVLHDYGDSSLTTEEKLQRALAGGLIGGAAGGALAAHIPSRLLKRGPKEAPDTHEALPTPAAPESAEHSAEAILQNPEAFGLGEAAAARRRAEAPKTEPETKAQEAPETSQGNPLYEYVIERARDRSAKDIRYGKRLEVASHFDYSHDGKEWGARIDPAIYSPNYEAEFLLTKGDVKKIEAGRITPEIEEKIRHDMQVMTEHPDWKEEGEAILSGKKPAPLDEVKLNEAGDLVGPDGVPIFANAGHNLAAGVGAGTVNALAGEYDPNRDFMSQIETKFLEGLAAGTLGTAAIRQLRHIAPESYERVRRAVLEHSYRDADGTIRLNANALESRYLNKRSDRVLENRLLQDAEPLPEPKSFNEFVRDFGTSGWAKVKTPIGSVSIDVRSAYRHFTENTYHQDRKWLTGAMMKTLEDPLFIIKNPEKKQIEFYRPFKGDDGAIHYVGIAKGEDGNLRYVTSFDKDIGQIKRMVKTPDRNLLYFKHSRFAKNGETVTGGTSATQNSWENGNEKRPNQTTAKSGADYTPHAQSSAGKDATQIIPDNDNGVKIGTFAGSAPRFAPADPPRPAGSFDDLERLAQERENRGWADLSERSGLGDIAAIGREYFTDTFSGAYHAARDATHAAIQKEQDGIERLARALDELDEGSDRELHRYLTGQSDGAALSEPVRKLADAIRGRVDALGRELVDEGILSPEAFKEWEGVYLHRLYEPHFDPAKLIKRGFKVDTIHERGESLSTGDYNKAVSWLQKRGYLSDEQAKVLKSDPQKSVKALTDYLDEAGITGALKEGKVSAQMLPGDRIKLRRDWSPSERQDMGEIDSAKLTVPETLSRLVRMREHARFLRRAAETEGVTLDAKAAAKMDPEEIKRAGYVKVAGRPYGALNGQWVRRDVAEDIGHTYKQITGEYRNAWRVWRSYYGTLKKSFTVWNPRAHFNNFVGNLFLMHLGGVKGTKIFDPLIKGWKQIGALKNLEQLETKKLLHGLSPEEEQTLNRLSKEARYAKEAKGLGIFGRSQLNDILAGMERSPQKSGVLHRMDTLAQKAYQAEDNFNRLSFYVTLREAGKTPERAKAMVDMLLPDYSRPLPKGWRFMRDYGVAPFISWAYYTVPSMMKMAKTKTGARKLATVLGALSAMEYFGSGEQVSPWDNLPFVKGDKPQDFKGRRFVFGHDGSQMHTVKLDTAIPYIGVAQDPYNFATGQISGPIPNLLYAIRGRRLYDGRRVTYPNKSVGDQALDWGKYLLNQYVPLPAPVKDGLSLIDSVVRSKESRRKNKTVVPRSTLQELFKAVGINTLSYDKDKIKH